MIDTVTAINTNILNFMADLIETQPDQQDDLAQIIKQHIHFNKESSYLIRIIERMILANRFDTAVLLAQTISKDDSQYIDAQTLANKALMLDQSEPRDKDRHLKNLIKIRLNIAMITRDPSDAMLLLTAMNELAGGTGFLTQTQRDDDNPLGTLLVDAALALRNARPKPESPLQQESVRHTLMFSQSGESSSNYSLIPSDAQASVQSNASHAAVSEASTYHPTRKRTNTV